MPAKPKLLPLSDDIRFYVQVAKGAYEVAPNFYFESCMAVYTHLYSSKSFTGMLSDLIRIACMCCSSSDVIETEEWGCCFKHLIDGLPWIIMHPKQGSMEASMFELVVQSLLVPLMRWRLPDGYDLGDPDCPVLYATDRKFYEKKEAEQYV